MPIDDRIQLLVLEEFRLTRPDTNGIVARLVGNAHPGREPAIPLLTSIDDRRNVATLRGVHAGESAEPDAAQRVLLEPFVSSWQAPKHYGPRITERSQSPPTHYRMAVTESGMNETSTPNRTATGTRSSATGIGLLWIGKPIDTHAGLVILLGSHEGSGTSDDPRATTGDWPLPLSQHLGVRIYESERP